MTRLHAAALVLLLWAAIYLPGLGSTELKGEEGRRILPAITMLETGQWLVPYVGGKPFLRKPPLVNWAIATSFKLTGVRNEWTARLPSALCVLALGLTIVATSGAGWMKAETAFVAAVLAMTQFGLLAKARFAGAEIEGIYVPLSGIAIVCWLAWWSRGCSPWLVWTVSGVFLGVASLAKGPSFHLIFYYAMVLTTLGAARRWRDLLHPAHFVSLALAAGIFAAWAVPFKRMPEAKDAEQVWKRQGIDRFTDSEFNAGNYFLNIPRGLMDQLPWLLLVPMIVAAGRSSSAKENDPSALGWTRIFREDARTVSGDPSFPALFLVTAASFVVVLLVPGTLPRYVLPLGVPFALWLAQALPEEGGLLRRWHTGNRLAAAFLLLGALAAPVAAGYPLVAGAAFDLAGAMRTGFVASLVLAGCAMVLVRRAQALRLAWVGGTSGALLGAAMLLYAAAAPRWIARSDNVRPVAVAIDAAAPPGVTLTIYDPGYLAAIFYLHTPYRYAVSLEEIPADARLVLARGKERRKLGDKRPDLEIVKVIVGKGSEEFLLLQPRGELQKLPSQ